MSTYLNFTYKLLFINVFFSHDKSLKRFERKYFTLTKFILYFEEYTKHFYQTPIKKAARKKL